MAAPAFVNAIVVHTDTTANASPIATDSYSVSASGHTLLAVIDHERANSTTPLNITGITRNGQSFTRANKGDLGTAASVDVADIWILENADVGNYPLSVSHNGVTGSDIQIGVVEYDGGTLGDVSTPAYVPGSTGAVATFDITIPADARLVYLQVVTTAGGTWTGPSHGTSRLTAAVATGTAGGAMAVADYVPASPPENATAIGYAFTPASSNWTNGSNHVIGIILEAVSGLTDLSGTSAGSASVSGTLTAYAHLSGTASGAATVAGTLTTGDDSLSGTAAGSSGAVGALTTYAHLTGTAAGAASAVANAWVMPVITRPVGGGDVDVAATIITDGLTASPTIELVGDPETNENITGSKWESLFTQIALGDAGRSVTFRVPFTDWRVSTPPTNNKGYIRHGSQIGNIYGWIPNDNRSVASGVLTAWNNSPLPEAVVQFANIPPVPYDELRAWIAAYHGHPNVFRPQACIDANYATSGADAYAFYEFASQTTPDGIDVGGTRAFAVGITKPGITPPGGKRRLFHTWTHAGESGGLRAMMREMERLIAESTADYTTMVEAAEHVFLFVNTAGMVGAMARGSAEPGDVGEDTNRVWGSNPISRGDVSDPQGVVEASVALLVTQWGVNGSNLLNCVGQIAWHSHTGSQTKFGTYSDGMNAAESFVITTIGTAYGTALHNYGASSTGSSTAFARTGTVGGFGITFEWSYAFADFLNEIGASVDTITPALAAAYAAGYFGTFLEGAAAGGSTATGALTAYGHLSGTAAGAATVSGTLSGDSSSLTGSAQGTSTAVGTLTAYARLTGSAAGVSSVSGALTARANLLGTASGSATAVGTLRAFANLSGTAAGIGSASGLLTTGDGITSPTPPERRAAAIGESRRAAA